MEPERRTLHTQSGRTLRYDALLLAVGTAAVEAVDGALTFRGPADVRAFGSLLEELAQRAGPPRGLRRCTTASGGHCRCTSSRCCRLRTSRRSGRGVDWKLVTHESAPLEMFGERASRVVAELLEDAGIEFVTRPRAAHGEAGLMLDDGETIEVERVVALPELRVPYLPGVPRGPGGLHTHRRRAGVKGLEGVFAAGDATSFPIKQGGIAAQQADAAAAANRGAGRSRGGPRPPDLLLRAALLTGSAPRFLRAALDDRDATSTAGSSVLWWPPGKIAARYLAPYLAGRAGAGEPPPLDDVEARFGEEPEAAEADRSAALELALTSADADADWGDFEAALRWLDVAERLNVVLPPGYAEKRERWGRLFANA